MGVYKRGHMSIKLESCSGGKSVGHKYTREAANTREDLH